MKKSFRTSFLSATLCTCWGNNGFSPFIWSATKECDNPPETAERIGLAALIIQVCHPINGKISFRNVESDLLSSWIICHFRTSKVFYRLIIGLTGITFFKAKAIRVSSCNIHMPGCTGIEGWFAPLFFLSQPSLGSE